MCGEHLICWEISVYGPLDMYCSANIFANGTFFTVWVMSKVQVNNGIGTQYNTTLLHKDVTQCTYTTHTHAHTIQMS